MHNDESSLASLQENLLSEELVVICQSIAYVESFLGEIFQRIDMRNLNNNSVIFLETTLKNIIYNYRQAFNMITTHDLTEHGLVLALYKKITEKHLGYFQRVLLHLAKLNMSQPVNLTPAAILKLLQSIITLLQPHDNARALHLSYQAFLEKPGLIIIKLEVEPIIQNLEKATSNFIPIYKKKNLQDDDLVKIEKGLTDIIVYYQQIIAKIINYKLTDYPYIQRFCQFIRESHQGFFHTLLTCLEDLDLIKHENFFKLKLPALLNQICETLQLINIQLIPLAAYHNKAQQTSANCIAFVELQQLNRSHLAILQQVKQAKATREQILITVKCYLDKIIPIYMNLQKLMPELALQYIESMAEIYAVEDLSLAYDEADSLTQKLAWLETDLNEIFQWLKQYSYIDNIYIFVLKSLTPFNLLRAQIDRQIAQIEKKRIQAVEQEKQAQAATEVINNTNQLIAGIVLELKSATEKNQAVLQLQLSKILTIYKQTLTQLSGRNMHGLKLLNDQALSLDDLLLHLEKPTMNLAERLAVCTDFQAWMMKQKKKHKLNPTQFGGDLLLTGLNNQIKLYHQADNFIKQAINAAVIQGQKRLKITNKEELQQKFSAALVAVNGELLNRCLNLAENILKLDKRTQQQLLKIFTHLDRSLKPPFSDANKENLHQLKVQFDLLLTTQSVSQKNELKSIATTSSLCNKIDFESQAKNTETLSRGGPCSQVVNNWRALTQNQPNHITSYSLFLAGNPYRLWPSDFSLFSTPIEEQIIKGSPTDDNSLNHIASKSLN